MREIVKFWRFNGIKIVMFLDDDWGINHTFDSAIEYVNFVRNSLYQAGLIVNVEQSVWVPVQNPEWIGLLWKCSNYSISIPSRRIDDLKTSLFEILNSLPFVTSRKLAQCAGRVISMPVIGNIVRFMTIFLYIQICSGRSWDILFLLKSNNLC